jgi:hypothetical protein
MRDVDGWTCLASPPRCHAISRHPLPSLGAAERQGQRQTQAKPRPSAATSLLRFPRWRQSAPPGHGGDCQKAAKARQGKARRVDL